MIQIEPRRKKMSSLEKDRQDLQSTIDALQEGINKQFFFFFTVEALIAYIYIYIMLK